MLKRILRVESEERGRFFLLALMLFVNSLVFESNDVVATTGFAVNVGVEEILWLWAGNMTLIILTSGVYSLIVDRAKRGTLTLILFSAFSVIYVAFYFLFNAGIPDYVSYPLLTIVNGQQLMLFPLSIWALANDVFPTAAAKRLFPVLGISALLGGILGNSLAAAISQWIPGEGFELLLINAWLIVMGGIALATMLPHIAVTTRQQRPGDKVLDALREGLGFVREVPTYRFLTISMILVGIGLNVIEFQLLVDALNTYHDRLPIFYGWFKAASVLALLLVQSLLAPWLLNRLGFKFIFLFMPGVLVIGAILALIWPSATSARFPLTGAITGDYLSRVTLAGIDEPSRRAFQGLVPDERRGRVSAFMDGYLIPIGSILGCAIIGLVLFFIRRDMLDYSIGRMIYLAAAGIGCLIGIWALSRFYVHYDTSMFNWRLSRRKRKSALDDVEF